MRKEEQWHFRTSCLIGDKGFNTLQNSSVAVIGLGGVGGACVEALCRSGVGKIILMDHDTISITNINRQLIATTKTIGHLKTDALLKRIKDINPECNVIVISEFFSEDTKELLFMNDINFIVDAIDTVSSKLILAAECKQRNINIIQSMGTGNRLDPTKFTLGSIEDTSGCGCGLARVMRRELKKRDIIQQPVLYSTEMPIDIVADYSYGRHSPASISFCPPVAGYILASYVIKKLINQ